MQSCTQWHTYNPSNSLNLVNHFHELITITVWYNIKSNICCLPLSCNLCFWFHYEAWSPFCSPWLSTLGIITLFDRWTGLKATNEHLHNPMPSMTVIFSFQTWIPACWRRKLMIFITTIFTTTRLSFSKHLWALCNTLPSIMPYMESVWCYRNWIELEGIKIAPNYSVKLRWRVIYWLVRLL